MDSSTGSELVVTLAWRSAQVAALAAAAMLLIALFVHRYLQIVARERARAVAVWRPLLRRIAIEEGGLPALPRFPKRHLPYLLEEWNALHDAVKGGSAIRLHRVALTLGFDVAARRMIHRRKIGRRILAIRTLGHLQDPSSWQSLQEQLASANTLVSFYAAAALVRIDPQRAMPGIMLQIAEREGWPGEAMARLLVDAGAEVAREPIRALMLSLAPAKLPPLLSWLARVDALLGSEVGVELLRRHPDDADLVAAALLVVRDRAVLPELARFAESANAGVRQNLAVALGQLGGLEQADLLMRLLCDTVWWVRYCAAQALFRLNGMTAAGIDAVRARLTDNYALDMLDHVQAERSAT